MLEAIFDLQGVTCFNYIVFIFCINQFRTELELMLNNKQLSGRKHFSNDRAENRKWKKQTAKYLDSCHRFVESRVWISPGSLGGLGPLKLLTAGPGEGSGTKANREKKGDDFTFRNWGKKKKTTSLRGTQRRWCRKCLKAAEAPIMWEFDVRQEVMTERRERTEDEICASACVVWLRLLVCVLRLIRRWRRLCIC